MTDTLASRLSEIVALAEEPHVCGDDPCEHRQRVALARVVKAARAWDQHSEVDEPWTHDRDRCEYGKALTAALDALAPVTPQKSEEEPK